MAVASYIIGHSGYVMLSYAISDTTNPMFLFLARSILAIFPNLEALNFKNYVATDAIIPENMYLLGFLIGIPYILIVLFLSAKVFEKKSFDAV